MNEEALKDSYGLFTQSGYSGTQDEFYTLLSDNAEAFADSYGLFKGSGYNGSEDDYKELLGLKKKDSSVLQDAAAPKDSGVSPSVSQDGQSSLEQDVQVSLEERLAKRKNLPIEEQIALAKQDELRPFYEAQGLNLDDKLNFEAIKKSKAEKEKKEKESEQDLSFFSKLYNRITSTEDLEEDFQTTDEDRADLYLSNNEENIFEAEKQYNIAKAKEITQVSSPDQRKEQFEEQGIDLGYMPTSFIKVNGEDFSVKELQKNLYDSEFIDKLQSEEVNVDIDNSIEDETLQSLIDLRDRQKESGGQWGDLAQSFYAGALDLLVAGPLEAVETIVMPRGYKEVITNVVGGTLGDKVNKYANKVRENTRVYQEEGMTKSLLKGNWSDAMFQTGNALSESAPLILSMYASAPLKLSQGVTLGFAGVSAGGLKSLELKEQRLKGEIDISDAQILLNSALTGGAEAFFERFTLDAVNASRKVFALGKITPGEIAEGFTKGFLRQARVEGLSEGATELSNMFTDLITRDIDYEKGELKETAISLEDVAVRFSDAAMIGSIMGGGIHTVPYMAKSMSKFKILDENIAVLFTMEDGSTQSMSRADALKFVKNPEVAERVRSSAVTMDASMNDIAKQELEEILYGFYAPDAVASREVMREKEGGVQNILDRIRDAEEVSTEDVNSLSQAVSEMEAEGKKSKYNISESTKATRGKLNAILKQKGIQIVDAVASQDVSMSKVTETVDATKIESQEQYDTVKKQLEDGKRKPTVVQSQNQSGIKVNGETSQTSEITQGKFKSVAAARNAMKDFEVNRDATKKGEVLDSDLFPVNNEIFLKAKKETLDEIPKEVIDNNDYHVLTSDKEGLTQEQRISRMEKLKSMLDKAGATYYTVQDVSNGVAKESLVVTGIDNATALNLGNQFQQESIFSSKDGKMFGDGRVVPLSNDVVKGPDARKKQDVTIMNVGGRKVSMHTGLDKLKTSYGKNFNSDNIHKLDESNADYDAELFQGLDDSRKRALGFAFKLLNSIGGLNVTVVRNSKAMEKQLEAIGQDPSKKRGSFFRGSDKTIYVNLETARGNTLFHEIIHPMVDFIKKTDPALYKRIEAEVKESDVKRRVMKDGRRMKGSYLEWAQSNPAYEGLSEEGLIEEAFAEMMGDAAYGHFVNKQSTLSRIREVIREILSRIGIVSPFENVESIDLNQMSLSDIRTNLAEALINGRKINVGGVEFEVGDTEETVLPRYQLDAIDRRTQVQYTYDVNSDAFSQMKDEGLITNGMTIQNFKGKTMMMHSPDATFSGSIIDKDGTILVEGKGGVYYTFKHNEDGYFWASTDNAAKSMVKQLNSMLEANDGKIYMGLTTAREGKLLSNTAMSRGLVNLFTSPNFISKIGLSKPKVYKALIDAANEVSPSGDGLKLGLKAYRASSKFEQNAIEKVWDKLDNSKSNFKNRSFFADKFLTYVKSSLESGSSKTNFVNFIKTTMGDESLVKFNKKGEPNVGSMKKALINVLTEPELRGEAVTDKVYAVLEIDGPVKAIKTDSYESYGTAIVSEKGNRAKIHRLDNREFWYDVAEDPMTNTVIGETTGKSSVGKISSRRSQIMPPMAGVSTTPLRISDDIRMQAPTYEMEYTPNSLISLSMLSDNNRQPEQWVKEIGKGVKGASKDVDTMGLLDLLKAYKKESKVKSIPKEVVAQLIATNMAQIETKILANKYLGKEDTYRYPEATLPGGENYREFLIKDKSPDDIFAAPHYDELGKNLIASARVDDRVGPNGEKILFVQEIQSDWVQGTNKGNFATKNEINLLKEELQSLLEEEVSINLDVKDGKFKKGDPEFYLAKNRIIKRRSDIQIELNEKRPYLPWNQTDLWVGLTIRKLINQASKEGYDQIAFVNGEQSDIVQSHTGDKKGLTHEFYNKIVPKNINNELKRLVKGMKYSLGNIKPKPRDGDTFYSQPFEERIPGKMAYKKIDQVVINLTPELKAATDKVGPLRFQAPQEETENVVYTSGLTTIAFDIAQAVVDADYKAGKYTTKQLAKVGIDKPRKDFGGYDIRLSKLLAKPFGSHSNEEIKEIMVRNRGDLQAELLRVDNNLKLLKNTIKDSDITPEQVNDLLHNVEDIKAMEKSELRTALLEMRTHIDELSRTLVREGLVAGQTMFTIDSNMGLYVTRSYRQFETKNWEQTDNDIIQNAKDFLYREVKNQNIRDVEDGKVDKDGNLITLMSEDAILNKAQESYDKLVEEKDFLKFSGGSSSLEGLTRVNSIFKQKKVIPEEIRELWGEIDSPLTNYSNTISKVAKTISAERMYRELNNIGQGKFISDNYDRTSTRNKLEGSKWGDLDGKYVDDEMYVVMNQVNRTFEKNGFQKAYDLYMQLVLFNKKMKTVWNPGTHAKNIIGNSSFAMMNGHLSTDFKQIYKDGSLSFQAFKSMKSEEFKELYDKLIRLGVVNSSASLAEIQNISEDLRNTNFDLTEYLKDKNGKIQKRMAKVSGTIREGISSFDEKLMKAYQAEDDVWKIFGYLSERGRYIKAGLDVAVAEETAAKNIRNLYPNYNEIPRIIRFLGRSPLVGSFVAFQAESVRNAKNTVMLGFEEMGSDNSKIRRIGATRIAGTIATMTLMEGLQLYTAQFLGEFLGFGGEDDDDVERRKMRLLLPEWDAPGNIAYMFRGFLESKQSEDQTERDRYFDYINFSSISGVGYMKDIMRLAFTDIDTQLGQDSALNILEKIYAPFLGQEMTSIAVTEALTNKGGKVFDQTDWPFKAIGKMIIYVGNKVQPGGGRVLQRGVESLYDEDSELVPGYEALAIFGIRINRVNVNKGLAIKSNFLFKDMVSRVGKGILKDPFALREEARSNSSFNEDLNKLADLIAASRLNSINGENVKAILSNSRVSRPVIDEAYNRYLDRYLEDAISVDDK